MSRVNIGLKEEGFYSVERTSRAIDKRMAEKERYEPVSLVTKCCHSGYQGFGLKIQGIDVVLCAKCKNETTLITQHEKGD